MNIQKVTIFDTQIENYYRMCPYVEKYRESSSCQGERKAGRKKVVVSSPTVRLEQVIVSI